MGSLVFVHGIGVRAPTDGGKHPLDATCQAIEWELYLKKIEWKLIKCVWGDDLGARLPANAKSIPKPRGRLGVAALPDDPAGLWEILLNDPTFELRALAAMPAGGIGVAPLGPPGVRPAWVDLQQRLAAGIQPTEALEKQLKRFAVQDCYRRAVAEVQADPAVAAAIMSPEAPRAIARAIVARTLRIALQEGIPVPGLDDVEAIVSDTEQLLRPAQLGGIGDWAGSVLLGWGTSWGARRRDTLSTQATPIAGDVIYYQAHGDRIRERIRTVIAEAPEPVAVLAHSLGGVATAEVLCETPALRQRVKKFITAGSQPSYFYEIDSLRTLPFGQPLPADFPDWLNFWDPRDFLSFLVAPVFAGGGARTDVEIKSGLPFPASHSGYWRQLTTWNEVKDFLAG